MSGIDNYGELEVPDEKSLVEVIEDPVKIVLAIYELYDSVVTDEEFEKKKYNYEYDEKIHEIAVNSFKGKEDLKVNVQQIKEILNEIIKKSHFNHEKYKLGIFLSAMQNSTSIDTLIIKSYSANRIGFKLKKNKCLVLKSYLVNDHAGRQNEGFIINYGKIRGFCSQNKDGLAINFGDIEEFGSFANGGLMIDDERRTWESPINNARNIHKGIFINCLGPGDYGKVELGKRHEGGTIINNCEKVNSIYRGVINLPGISKLAPLKKKLDEKLNELKKLRGITYYQHSDFDEEKIAKIITQFDFQKFEREITEIAKEIKEKYDEMIR